MSFGLHLGWAIEGAIGSYFKIDVSYLSPNVNFTQHLQEHAHLYNVPLLISGQLYDNFSEETQQYCRKIDYILMKGQEKPVWAYTCDVIADYLEVEEVKPVLTPLELKK